MNIEKFGRRTWLKLTLYGSILFFGSMAVTYGAGKNWEEYQQEYIRQVAALSGKEVEKSTLGIKVIKIPELGIRDRCTTCHVATDDLRMYGAKNPLKPHPSRYLQQHPPERFGCTTCHGGEGESLDTAKAHSGTFRRGDVVQVSCSSCHTRVLLEGAPGLNDGKSLLNENHCTDCHYAEDLSGTEDFIPAPMLRGIGDKVGEKWLWRWLKAPKSYMPNARMPRYEIDEKYVDGLIGYLISSKGPPYDPDFKYPEGDIDRGKTVLRFSFCITCHPFNGKGGKEAPDLGRIGNKVTEKWLVQMLANPHGFQPNTPMPQYNLNLQQLSDVAAYMLDEFTDYDMLDEDKAKKPPKFWGSPEERHEIGRRVYKELRCANCHGLLEEGGLWWKIGPEFTFIGDKPLHEINFGDSRIPRTLPDYLFEKIRNPQVYATPENFMKMPKYDLSNARIRDAVLSLLSFNSDKVTVKGYRSPKTARKKRGPEVPAIPILSPETTVAETYHPIKPEVKRYEPEEKFGRLVDKYRCFSCHSFKGRGHNISYDLTVEGSRVRREWLLNYLKHPYSIRPIMTIRMPIFNMTDDEAKVLTSAIIRKMFDGKMENDLEGKLSGQMLDRGKKLFEEKGCLACHQMGQKGGYVGPSFTQGAFVGEKLRPGWTFEWLKNPRSMKPDVLEPSYSLSDPEALVLTAYLMSIKTPHLSGAKNDKND